MTHSAPNSLAFTSRHFVFCFFCSVQQFHRHVAFSVLPVRFDLPGGTMECSLARPVPGDEGVDLDYTLCLVSILTVLLIIASGGRRRVH